MGLKKCISRISCALESRVITINFEQGDSDIEIIELQFQNLDTGNTSLFVGIMATIVGSK